MYNRQYFMEELEISVTKAINSSETAVLLYLLIDEYKSIKDEVGLATADLVLSDIAKILQSKIREPNIAARFEGDVFTLLLPDKNNVDAEAVAKELCHIIDGHIVEIEDRSFATTCSIGISLVTETTPNAHEVLYVPIWPVQLL